MKRTAIVTGIAAAALAAGLVGAGTAGAAAPARSRLSSQDAQFLRQNDQTDLAEVTLGRYVEQHTHSDSLAHRFATEVVHDHEVVLAADHHLARAHGITEPRLPSFMQRAAARKVKAAGNTSRTYLQTEIAGHKTSIAQTKKEIASGSNKDVVTFARYYLPIAEHHLMDAQHKLARYNTGR